MHITDETMVLPCPSPNQLGCIKEGAKRRRLSPKKPLHLLDLPQDVLASIVSMYLPTVADRFSLQLTNKLFRNLSNAPEITQCMRLLKPSNDALRFIRKDDSSPLVLKRLLPFLKHSNRDALFLLGLIGIYVEDDLEVGLALLHQGKQAGDVRCTYEIGNFFLRSIRSPADRTAGRGWMEEAAAAGHVPALLETGMASLTRGESVIANLRARQEMMTTECLKHLVWNKADQPPDTNYRHTTDEADEEEVVKVCANPLCFRQSYNVGIRPVRLWLKAKKHPNSWKRYVQALPHHPDQENMTPFPLYRQNNRSLYYVPPLYSTCQDCCRQAPHYCGRACQLLHQGKEA